MPVNPDFAAELRKRVSGDVRLDLTSRVLYSTDASIYHIEPLGVVIPRHRMICKPSSSWRPNTVSL